VVQRINEALSPAIRVSIVQHGNADRYLRLLESGLRGARIKHGIVAQRLTSALWPAELSEVVRQGDVAALIEKAELNATQAEKVMAALGGSELLFDLETVDLMAYRLNLKQAEMDSVAMALYRLRTEYGIIDYPNQSREVARGYLRTVDGNNSSSINSKAIMKLKKNIEEKGGEWTKFNDRYFDLIDEYGSYKVDYEWAMTNVACLKS